MAQGDISFSHSNMDTPSVPPTLTSSSTTGSAAASHPQWHTCSGGCDGFGCTFALKEMLPLEDVGRPVGQGSFCQVKKVRSTTNKADYALKEIIWGSNRAKLEVILKEVRVHRRLNHRHITSVAGSFTRGKYSCGILLQPVADYDLGEYLHHILDKQETCLPTGEDIRPLQRSFGCLASGLAYLHGQRVKHKDIKPANILIHGGSVLFTDVGISTDFFFAFDESTSTGPTGFTREVNPISQPCSLVCS